MIETRQIIRLRKIELVSEAIKQAREDKLKYNPDAKDLHSQAFIARIKGYTFTEEELLTAKKAVEEIIGAIVESIHQNGDFVAIDLITGKISDRKLSSLFSADDFEHLLKQIKLGK